MLAGAAACGAATATDLEDLVADRTAVERVYHHHRLGAKPPFEQALPAAEIERLVKADRQKETTLATVYHVEITNPLVESEVKHIDTETRAPNLLAEIKAALDNDPARFARAVAKPIVVDHELRSRFENDERLHVLQREQAETVRRKLLAAPRRIGSWPAIQQTLKEPKVGTVIEVTWQFGARPVATSTPSAPVASPMLVRARSVKYSVEATAQIAQALAPPNPTNEIGRSLYFEDLSDQLKSVLRVQLQNPGDISAVIETPTGFLLLVAKEKTAATLSAAALSIPKRSFEQWLAEQSQ